MKYDTGNQVSLAKLRFRLDTLIKGQKMVELKVIHPIRSNQQNRYFHVLVAYFAAEYGETKDHVKQKIFKTIVNPEIFLGTYENKKQHYTRDEIRSTADLDTGELTLAIERFRDYAAKEADIYLPQPGEEDFLKHCEETIDQHKQWI